MADVFSTRKRSAIMARVRGSGNRDTELRLILVFRANGITGWRRGAKLGFAVEGPRLKVEGRKPRFTVRPDFVFPRLRTAVFVDGCFWHGCPKHATWPKANAAFWRKKIRSNMVRDRQVNRVLRKRGWNVIRIWEHELGRKNERRLFRRLAGIASPSSR